MLFSIKEVTKPGVMFYALKSWADGSEAPEPIAVPVGAHVIGLHDPADNRLEPAVIGIILPAYRDHIERLVQALNDEILMRKDVYRVTRALSIKQPWAWLIVNGHKSIENRDWRINDPAGEFWIHASSKVDLEAYDWVQDNFPGIEMPALADMPRGGIVGIAEHYGTVTESDSPWFIGRYGLLLRGARPCKFVEIKGAQKFFNVDLSSVNIDWNPTLSFL